MLRIDHIFQCVWSFAIIYTNVCKNFIWPKVSSAGWILSWGVGQNFSEIHLHILCTVLYDSHFQATYIKTLKSMRNLGEWGWWWAASTLNKSINVIKLLKVLYKEGSYCQEGGYFPHSTIHCVDKCKQSKDNTFWQSLLKSLSPFFRWTKWKTQHNSPTSTFIIGQIHFEMVWEL